MRHMMLDSMNRTMNSVVSKVDINRIDEKIATPNIRCATAASWAQMAVNRMLVRRVLGLSSFTMSGSLESTAGVISYCKVL